MKSETIALLDFMKESKQLEIPIYQRTYSWEKENCEQLWEDIVQIGKAEADEFEPEHFVGTVIYIEKRNGQARYVIDGQQRLTTAALIIEALAQFNEANREEIGASAEELRRRFLFDPTKMGDAAHKLLLSQTDKETLMALVAQQDEPENYSIRIHDNFNFFQKKIQGAVKRDRDALWPGLNRLTMISIALDRSQESPQRVFESMNDRGVELSNADLILHYLLMDLSAADQEQLYDAHWSPIENMLGQTEIEDMPGQTEKMFDQGEFSKHFNDFIFYYLGMKVGKLPVKKRMYSEFKAHAAYQMENSVNAQEIVAEIHRYAGYYSAIKLGRKTNDRLDAAFNDLQLLRANTPIPFLMALYDLYSERGAALRALAKHLPNLPTEKLVSVIREMRDTGGISSFGGIIDGNNNSIDTAQAYAGHAQTRLLGADQFEQIVRIVESCVVRRLVCAMGGAGMGSLFVKYAHDVHKTKLTAIARERAQNMQEGLKCPSDSDFAQALKESILIGRPHCAYILRRMENYGRWEPLDLNDHNVEPILPEGSLSKEWQEELGENWKEAHEELAKTLGNLTLKKGSYFAGRPFAHKRDLETGYRNSRLWLNHIPGSAQRWDAATIRARAEVLAERALEVWPRA